jgi:hypothetical protein
MLEWLRPGGHDQEAGVGGKGAEYHEETRDQWVMSKTSILLLAEALPSERGRHHVYFRLHQIRV